MIDNHLLANKSTQCHLDLKGASTGDKNVYWMMDIALDRNLEYLLREVLLGRNPDEDSAIGSPSFAESIVWVKL